MAGLEAGNSPKAGFSFGRLLAGIGFFLLQIILPVLIGSGVAYWLAGFLKIWSLNRTLAMVIFVLILLFFSTFVAVVLSTFLPHGSSRLSRQLRLVAIIIGGLLIPIGIFIVANVFYIAPGESYMGRLINLSPAPAVEAPPVGSLASAVIAARDPYTKVEGIKAIGSVHVPDSLQQLLSILNSDAAALATPSVSAALAHELGAFGVDARPGLLAAFQKHAHSGQTVTPPPGSLYERFFAPAVAALQAEVSAQPIDDLAKKDRLQKIATLGDKVRADSSDFPADFLPVSDPVLDTVCDAFLQMSLTSDSDLVNFARASAADASLPESARGKALLLLAKLGGKDDLPVLSSYLTNSSERIKAAAFTAIANLNQKLSKPK